MNATILGTYRFVLACSPVLLGLGEPWRLLRIEILGTLTPQRLLYQLVSCLL